MAARHEEGCYGQYIANYVLVCKGVSSDDVVVTRDAVFRGIRPGAGFETGNFRKERVGAIPFFVQRFMTR